MNLNIDNLSFSYSNDKKDILSNLTLKIEKEGIYIIEGINGCGKSTLLKIIASIIDVEPEKVMFNGVCVGNKMYKKMMGYIPDTPILYNELTGYEHAEIFMDLWDMTVIERKNYMERFEEVARKLSLNTFLKQKAGVLSYGTKYKLFFSLTISRNTKLLLLDEPFSSLDIKSQDVAINFIRECGKNSIIIVSSHQKEVINKLSENIYEDNIYELKNGYLEQISNEKILENIYNG